MSYLNNHVLWDTLQHYISFLFVPDEPESDDEPKSDEKLLDDEPESDEPESNERLLSENFSFFFIFLFLQSVKIYRFLYKGFR